MSSTFRSYAVVGVGTIGQCVVEGLLKKSARVLVLNCADSHTVVESHSPNVTIVTLDDCNDIDMAAEILRQHRVEVVISTLRTTVPFLQYQCAIARAAKAAGVQFFVPSEYGVVQDGVPGPKSDAVEFLEDLGLPYMRIYSGFFMEYIPWLTDIYINGCINAIGLGFTPASFTAEEDVGGFIAHILTTVPPRFLVNKSFRIEGDRASMQELANMFHTSIEYIDEDNYPTDVEHLIKMRLLRTMERGEASTGWNPRKGRENEKGEVAGYSNNIWFGHKWRKIKDIHESYCSGVTDPLT